MKRTLTAAATLVAGGVGVVGFAGTAAADTPQLPAELPVDNNVAQTAYHAAGTMHSATKVVGDVVPAPDTLTGRSAQSADDGGGPLGGLTGKLGLDKLLGQSPVLGGATGKSAAPVDADGGSSSLGGLPVGKVVGLLD